MKTEQKQINEGDVFNFSYKPEIREKMSYPDHCFDGQLVARKNSDGEIVLIDTYWGSSDRHFTIGEAEEKGILTFRFNIGEVENTNEDVERYYKKEDWFNFSHQHGCYKRFVVRKGAKKDKEIMLNAIGEKLREKHEKIKSLSWDIQRLGEDKARIEAGDLTIYI